MKKNMVPLLGIAFVVAIISTGIFYGLFAGLLKSNVGEAGQTIVVAARDLSRGTVLQSGDLRLSQVRGALQGSFAKPEELVGATLLEAARQNEPLLEERVGTRQGTGRSGTVPQGMRALSIRVSESAGVLNWLKSGARVDIQAVTERNNSTDLRTILQNVEVLAVNPQLEPPAGNRPAAAVVTVLARAQDADVVALADSGARIRVALRNPMDDATSPRHALSLASVFQNTGTAPSAVSARTAGLSAQPNAGGSAAWDHPVQLHVQALGISAEALRELEAKLAGSHHDGALQVNAFQPETDAAAWIHGLEQKQQAEVVSSWRLMAGVGRPISFRAGVPPYQLRVQFAPEAGSGGKISLRVKPEISVQSGDGVETRKFDAGIPDGASFVVQGLILDRQDRQALERLFPGHTWSGRDLVIVVTSGGSKEIAAAPVPASRGR